MGPFGEIIPVISTNHLFLPLTAGTANQIKDFNKAEQAPSRSSRMPYKAAAGSPSNEGARLGHGSEATLSPWREHPQQHRPGRVFRVLPLALR